MQVIAGALLAGVVVFAVIVLTVFADESASPGIVNYLAAGFAVVAGVGHRVVGQVVADAMATATPAEAFTTRTILTLAVLEGAALFNLVAMILDSWLPQLMFVAALVALMVIAFPTPATYRKFAANRAT